MKKLSVAKLMMSTIFGLFICMSVMAQEEKKMASPPESVEGEINGAKISIHYHSPSVKGREIFGGLVPYGKVWRAGANNATTFETDKDLKIQGETLPAGKYSFFILPGEEESVFIFNTVAKQWGAYDYDESKDALRVTVPVEEMDEMEEMLVYKIVDDGIEVKWNHTKFKAIIE
ncbi:DUF2911 domain-containing protein [Echinicola jeungdonensis]|uniref:DUF2911 domain-containing protein n=1 Tax=Echinicola jeungdonensis TaxID=709343 RepID=A0ABV5J5E7_9BACT|nr:DUF2911 domain-containing protein [Echinicola jeungdonensis]MDN3670851.1 DUF2911 domain-containing protein [Echinicola jeungdonensis]